MDLDKQILELTFTLYENIRFARTDVQFIIKLVQEFIKNSYNPFLLNKLNENLYNAVSEEVSDEIKKTFNAYQDPFSTYDSEDKRLRIYRKMHLYINPVLTPIAEIPIPLGLPKNKVLIQYETISIVHLPLKNSLSRLLKIDGLLEATLDYMEHLKTQEDVLINFVQGTLWKRQLENFRKSGIVLPLFIFFDDVETGNALGSHAGLNEIGAVYAMIPCLPPNFSSKLESIILSDIFYSHDRKKFGNKLIFKPLIKELNDLLENGVEIDINNKKHKLYFITSLIIGDNLGLNGIFGFTESFLLTHCCRTCYAGPVEIQSLVSENIDLLRTKEKYENDCKKIDTSKTGIKEECVFNEVKGFHVIENQTVDLMHDFFEGVCNYVLSQLLLHFIWEEKLFSLDDLNYRLRSMNFEFESSNVSPQINGDYLKKKTRNLKCLQQKCFFLLDILG